MSLFRGGSRINRRRGANPPRGVGRQHTIFAKFSEKLHENEILGHRGAHTGGTPLRSTTAVPVKIGH